MRPLFRPLSLPVLVMALFVLVLAVGGCAPASTDQPTSADQPTATPLPPAQQPAGASHSFVIDPAQSEARFVIDEELMGRPVTVVGVNSGVAGQMTVDPASLDNVEIGPITIDASGFVTDSSRRNGAINRFILQSSSYATITFTPTAIEGLPESVAVSDALSLQVTGDLTIREITRAETFAVTVQVVSQRELHVGGATQILRENYELTIPNVPSVANVTNEVQLEFDFVVTAE